MSIIDVDFDARDAARLEKLGTDGLAEGIGGTPISGVWEADVKLTDFGKNSAFTWMQNGREE